MPRQLTRYATDAGPQFIYVIGSESLTPVKIGRSNDPAKRIVVLQTGNPVSLSVLWQCPGDQVLEAALHREFKKFQTESRNEWFDFGEDDPVEKVAAAAERLDQAVSDERLRRQQYNKRQRAKRMEELGEVMRLDRLQRRSTT